MVSTGTLSSKRRPVSVTVLSLRDLRRSQVIFSVSGLAGAGRSAPNHLGFAYKQLALEPS